MKLERSSFKWILLIAVEFDLFAHLIGNYKVTILEQLGYYISITLIEDDTGWDKQLGINCACPHIHIV